MQLNNDELITHLGLAPVNACQAAETANRFTPAFVAASAPSS